MPHLSKDVSPGKDMSIDLVTTLASGRVFDSQFVEILINVGGCCWAPLSEDVTENGQIKTNDQPRPVTLLVHLLQHGLQYEFQKLITSAQHSPQLLQLFQTGALLSAGRRALRQPVTRTLSVKRQQRLQGEKSLGCFKFRKMLDGHKQHCADFLLFFLFLCLSGQRWSGAHSQVKKCTNIRKG